MAYSRSFDADGILVTRLSGVVTIEELRELQKGLGSYISDGNVYELVFHADDVDLTIKSTETRASAYRFNELKGPAQATIAFVCDSNYIFGTCRQLVLQIENDFARVCVFRTEEAARRWLHEMRALNATAPKPALIL